MASTVIETLDVDFADNTIAVLCNDDAGICGIGTDFIFDALNPACYLAGALPASGAIVPVGGLLNLARDVAPAIPRTGAVTAVESNTDGSASPTFDGKGWNIGGSSGTKRPFNVKKVGLADNRVDEPVLEGFLDFLIMATFKVTTFSVNYGLGIIGAGVSNPGANGFGSIQTVSTGGNLATGIGGVNATIGTIALNTLVHAAGLFRFNTGADTSTIRPYLNGVAGAQIAGPAPSTLASNVASARATLGHFVGLSLNSGAITLHRAVRDYVGKSGLDDAAVAALVAKDAAYALARFV